MMHRMEGTTEGPAYVFRFKLFNGQEYYILAPNLETAMVQFQKHPSYEKRILAAAEVCKVEPS